MNVKSLFGAITLVVGLAVYLLTSVTTQKVDDYYNPPVTSIEPIKVTLLDIDSTAQIKDWQNFSEEVFNLPFPLTAKDVPRSARTQECTYDLLICDVFSWQDVLRVYAQRGITISFENGVFKPEDVIDDIPRTTTSVFWVVNSAGAKSANDSGWVAKDDIRFHMLTVKEWLVFNLFYHWKYKQFLDIEGTATMCGDSSMYTSGYTISPKACMVSPHEVKITAGCRHQFRPGSFVSRRTVRERIVRQNLAQR